MSFNDKVVLVTGASSGIGAAIAENFASEGAKVAIIGRNAEKLNSVAQKCEKFGKKVAIIIADVSVDEDAKRLVNTTLTEFGKLDILVNNAGVGGTCSILEENAVKMYDKVMNTNLRAVINITNIAAPHIVETKGNIINISSVAGSSIITAKSSVYCASKAGLDHFTRCVALELAPKGVRVNIVSPGPVNTDIIDNMGIPVEAVRNKLWEWFKEATAFRRISEPEEIADVVLFLASSKAQGITGSNYVVDNGAMLKGTWVKEM